MRRIAAKSVADTLADMEKEAVRIHDGKATIPEMNKYAVARGGTMATPAAASCTLRMVPWQLGRRAGSNGQAQKGGVLHGAPLIVAI
jgi:hypothetical protein